MQCARAPPLLASLYALEPRRRRKGGRRAAVQAQARARVDGRVLVLDLRARNVQGDAGAQGRVRTGCRGLDAGGLIMKRTQQAEKHASTGTQGRQRTRMHCTRTQRSRIASGKIWRARAPVAAGTREINKSTTSATHAQMQPARGRVHREHARERRGRGGVGYGARTCTPTTHACAPRATRNEHAICSTRAL